jgi:hypothetical protein
MRHHQRVATAIAASACTLALSGCLSIHDPDAESPNPTHTHATATTTNREPAPERDGSIPPAARKAQTQLSPGAAQRTQLTALERYAALWSNWTAADIVARQRQLAGISLGQARAQALQAATTLQNDSTLAHSQVSNTGLLIAAAPALQGGEWVLVTRETTIGQGDYAGLPATLHVTYAQLTHTPGGYVVSTWAPQN